MFPTPSGRKTFVVKCKQCGRDVPSGREEFPFQSITVECPLCRERRQYRPSEVFLGRPDQLVMNQQRLAVDKEYRVKPVSSSRANTKIFFPACR
jgi:endogenous inhibitor of DNA gyrase (YacG/DUF329 family)